MWHAQPSIYVYTQRDCSSITQTSHVARLSSLISRRAWNVALPACNSILFAMRSFFVCVCVCFKPGQRTCTAGFICRRLLAEFLFFFSCFVFCDFCSFLLSSSNKTHCTLDTLRSGERPASPCTSLNILIKSYRLQTIETKQKKSVTGHPTKEQAAIPSGQVSLLLLVLFNTCAAARRSDNLISVEQKRQTFKSWNCHHLCFYIFL